MKNSVIIIMVLLSFILGAQNSDTVMVNQLNWLAGYWTAENGDTRMEEFWLPESNGLLVGLHRDSFGSGNTFVEYLRIEKSKDTIIYKASPRGKEPTSFYLKAVETHSVVFENLDHDFPQRIMYSLIGDTLDVKIEGYVNGKLKFSKWQWIKTVPVF